MRTFKQPCGCTWTRDHRDRDQWLSFCPAHEAEDQERHQRWAVEHLRTMAEFNRPATATHAA